MANTLWGNRSPGNFPKLWKVNSTVSSTLGLFFFSFEEQNPSSGENKEEKFKISRSQIVQWLKNRKPAGWHLSCAGNEEGIWSLFALYIPGKFVLYEENIVANSCKKHNFCQFRFLKKKKCFLIIFIWMELALFLYGKIKMYILTTLYT